jgi:hypothetical protein
VVDGGQTLELGLPTATAENRRVVIRRFFGRLKLRAIVQTRTVPLSGAESLCGAEIHTGGSNPSRSATNLVSETTKELDLRRAGFARDFRPLSAVRFRDRRQRRFWAICGPSAPENLELLFQWCGSLPADNDCVVDGVARGRSSLSPVRDWRFRGGRNATGVKR